MSGTALKRRPHPDMAVRIRIHDAALEAWLTGPQGPPMRHMKRVTDAVVGAAKVRCPVDEGPLRASIHAVITVTSKRITAVIKADQSYARFVHQGTGLYGLDRPPHLIAPVRAKALRFRLSRSGSGARLANTTAVQRRGPFVFAAYTRGQRPQPFLWEGLRDVLGARARRRR